MIYFIKTQHGAQDSREGQQTIFLRQYDWILQEVFLPPSEQGTIASRQYVAIPIHVRSIGQRKNKALPYWLSNDWRRIGFPALPADVPHHRKWAVSGASVLEHHRIEVTFIKAADCIEVFLASIACGWLHKYPIFLPTRFYQPVPNRE